MYHMTMCDEVVMKLTSGIKMKKRKRPSNTRGHLDCVKNGFCSCDDPLILSEEDTRYAANVFINFFSPLENIADYMRTSKLDRMERGTLEDFFDEGPEKNFFNDYSMSPMDMDFELVPVDKKLNNEFNKPKAFEDHLDIVSSHNNMLSIPGRELKVVIKEKVTDTIVGFIRLGSPTINSKPRNEFLGEPLSGKHLERFNQSASMGFIIVPVQPFGYNYLGGKLLAAICCSHAMKEIFDNKYDSNLCLFETTSLYGTSKDSSQYDGMKPFLRFKGLTDSNFAPVLPDTKFREIYNWFKQKNAIYHGMDVGEELPLIWEKASSKKLKKMTRMFSIITTSAKKHGMTELLKEFKDCTTHAKNLTEQKRFYMSDYGFANVSDYILGKTNELEKKENYDRFSFDNAVKWWQNKATKRFESLKREDRLRTKLELWSKNPDEIDIIR